MYGPYGQADNKPDFFPVHTSDVSLYEEPILEYVKRSMRRGILPLWNPHQGCGYPIIGHMHIGMFYPLNLIFNLLPDRYAWDFLILARMFLGGLFMYCFIRTLKLSFFPALAGAVIFMLGPPMVMLQAWMINTDLLFPLLFLVIEKNIRAPRRGYLVFLAGVIALSCFAGHPEHLILLHGGAFLYLVFRLMTLRPSEPKKILLQSAGAYALGLGLAAIVLLPFLYNWQYEFWHGHPGEMGITADYSGSRYFSLSTLFPYYFQNVPLTSDFKAAGMWGVYGILPPGLALLGLRRNGRCKLSWFFFGVAAFILVKILVNPPFFHWIFSLYPFKYLRISLHASHMVLFCLATLGALAIEAIMSHKPAVLRFLLFALFCWGLLAYSLYCDRAEPYFNNALNTAVFSSLILAAFLLVLFLNHKRIGPQPWLIGILIGIIVAELYYYVPRPQVSKFDSFPPVPYIEYIKKAQPRSRVYGVTWTLYPDTASAYQIDDVGISEALLPERFVRYINTFVWPNYFNKEKQVTALFVIPIMVYPNAKSFLDLINLRFVAAPNPMIALPEIPHLEELFPDPIYSREVNVYDFKQAYPRAFVVHRAIFHEDEEAVIKEMKTESRKLRFLAVIHRPPDQEILQQLKSIPLIDASTVTIKKYSPNEVILNAEMENAGLVVLSDSYHPDWKAFIDGKRTEIFITDFLIRSVFVPQGSHQIRFVFKPVSFYAGAIVSFLSLLILLAILFWSRKKIPYSPLE